VPRSEKSQVPVHPGGPHLTSKSFPGSRGNEQRHRPSVIHLQALLGIQFPVPKSQSYPDRQPQLCLVIKLVEPHCERSQAQLLSHQFGLLASVNEQLFIGVIKSEHLQVHLPVGASQSYPKGQAQFFLRFNVPHWSGTHCPLLSQYQARFSPSAFPK